MKITKLPIRLLLAFTILLFGCSKEDDNLTSPNDKSYLSFSVMLNDLVGQMPYKQMQPETSPCPTGSPAFVEIVIRMGEIYVAGTEGSPLRMELDPGSHDTNADGIPDPHTKESAALELAEGIYTLDYFTVLDAEENVIWLAPVKEKPSGPLDPMASHTLPLNINMGAGVTKYQDVEVICFDERNLNDYGYIFYDLNGFQVIEFCIFGNYCDANGRHAEFMLFETDVWKYSGDPMAPKGALLHEDLQNQVIITDYEDYADTQSFPLCFTLPDGPGGDEYYVEITQVQLGAQDILIRSGLISDIDVRDLFRDNGTIDYFHFIEGECDIEDEPVLLNDPREIIGAWEFTFVFGGDAIVAADVVFYEDGTASYSDHWTSENPVLGSWSYFNHTLFYYPDGDNDLDGYYDFSGSFTNGNLSGTSWQGGIQNEWTAERKD